MLDSSQFTRLIDIAYAGCHNGMALDARTIFNSILVIKPGHVPALIGLALSHIVVNELVKAETMLKDILSEHADDADAKCMLGFCLFLMNRKDESAEILTPLKNIDSSAGALASSLLQSMV